MDLYFQGQAALNKGVNPENMAQARGDFERALALDPGISTRCSELGGSTIRSGGADLSDDRDAQLTAGEAAIAKVLSQRPNDALAHEIMGGVLNQTNRSEQGIAELEWALALDPNLATAHGDIGLAKLLVGRPEETEAHEREALRLSPRDSFAGPWLNFIGAAKTELGERRGRRIFSPSIEINRTSSLTHFSSRRRWRSRGEERPSRSQGRPRARSGLHDTAFSQWQRERRAPHRRHAPGRRAGRVSELGGRSTRSARARRERSMDVGLIGLGNMGSGDGAEPSQGRPCVTVHNRIARQGRGPGGLWREGRRELGRGVAQPGCHHHAR